MVAHCEIRTRAFRLRSEGATTQLRTLMSVEWIKFHLVLTVLFVLNTCLPAAHSRYSKIICRLFYKLYTVSKLLNWLNSKTIQMLNDKNRRQIILLHLPCAAGKFIAEPKGALIAHLSTISTFGCWMQDIGCRMLDVG